jgi:uncharacterized protein YjbI with pentapeptide repeats
MMTKINNWFINLYKKLFEIAGKYWGITITVLLLIVVGFVILAFIFGWGWTGFFAYSTGPQDHPGKTLWDVLSLAIIPLALVLIAYFFNKRQKESELEIAKEERELDREIAQDRQREAALQAYLDRMMELLRNELGEPEPDKKVKAVAQTLTIVTMRRLDGKRNETLLRFLRRVGLSESYFRNADLRKIDLSQTSLPRIDLSNANLSGANLFWADLRKADLSKADLSEANLFWADLSEADLRWANLFNADLRGAGLFRADLNEANLSGADLSEANLRFADLQGAILFKTDLSKARYNAGTTWPSEDFDPEAEGAINVDD